MARRLDPFLAIARAPSCICPPLPSLAELAMASSTVLCVNAGSRIGAFVARAVVEYDRSALIGRVTPSDVASKAKIRLVKRDDAHQKALRLLDRPE